MLNVVTHPVYSAVPLPERHPFPMEKFAEICKQLRERGWIPDSCWHQPEICQRAILQRAHTSEYLDHLWHGTLDPKAERTIGLPWSKQLATRTFTAVGGTLLTAQLALSHGVACHLAGGTHHAHADAGSGYCLLNDLAIVALDLLANGINKVAIIDADVHQGDGTARILANEPRAITCSIHNEKNFPLRKATSDYDIALPNGLDDTAYLHAFTEIVDHILLHDQPDIVLYDAGVDVHIDDRLGHLHLTDMGMLQRDEYIIRQCKNIGIPCATVIGGGYDRDITALARRHLIVVQAACAVWTPEVLEDNALVYS